MYQNFILGEQLTNSTSYQHRHRQLYRCAVAAVPRQPAILLSSPHQFTTNRITICSSLTRRSILNISSDRAPGPHSFSRTWSSSAVDDGHHLVLELDDMHSWFLTIERPSCVYWKRPTSVVKMNVAKRAYSIANLDKTGYVLPSSSRVGMLKRDLLVYVSLRAILSLCKWWSHKMTDRGKSHIRRSFY